jgi:hypothetical protein
VEKKLLVLGGIEFPMILPRDIPVWTCVCASESFGSCKGHGTDYDDAAGIVGMSAKKKAGKNEDNFDCFQPRAGWWVLEDARTPFRRDA